MHKESTLQNEHDSKPVDSAYLADMPIQSAENEQLDEFEVAQEKPIFTYLKKHIEAFDPAPEEYKFIDEKLDFVDGKVAIGGWLIWVTLNIIFRTFCLLIYTITTFKSSFFRASLIAVMFMVYAMMLYYFLKKRKYGLFLYRIVQSLSFIFGLYAYISNQTILTCENLIFVTIWLIYSFKSVRLKYTLVEEE